MPLDTCDFQGKPQGSRPKSAGYAPRLPSPAARSSEASEQHLFKPSNDAKPGPTRHIGVFMYALTGGGAQRRTLTLAKAFAARGHRVDLIVACSHGDLNGEVPRSVRLVNLDSNWHPICTVVNRLSHQRGLQTLSSIPALARYLQSERPDVLLSSANHVNIVALLAWILAKRPQPIVLRASNFPSGNLHLWPPAQRALRTYLRWLLGRLYPLASAVVAVSQGVADEVARLTGMPRDRLSTIYNPVVTPELIEKTKAEIDHPWFMPGSPPVVLGVGRLSIQKDFATLVRAFARVRAARPARLIILGEGMQRKMLEAMAVKLGVREDVLLPGYVDNPLAWMAKASAFVLCSAWEGLPGVLIEALASGCPVVSTDCPCGPAEILDHGRYGPLVPCQDDKVLAEAILSVLDLPPDRDRLRSRAAEFSADGAPDRYLEVLEECILRWDRRHPSGSKEESSEAAGSCAFAEEKVESRKGSA